MSNLLVPRGVNLYEPPAEHAGEGDLPCLFLGFLLPRGVRDPLDLEVDLDLDLDLNLLGLGDFPLLDPFPNLANAAATASSILPFKSA